MSLGSSITQDRNTPGMSGGGSGIVYRIYRCNIWLTYLSFYVAWTRDSVIRLPGVDSHSVFINFLLFLSLFFGYFRDMILKNKLDSSKFCSDRSVIILFPFIIFIDVDFCMHNWVISIILLFFLFALLDIFIAISISTFNKNLLRCGKDCIITHC